MHSRSAVSFLAILLCSAEVMFAASGSAWTDFKGSTVKGKNQDEIAAFPANPRVLEESGELFFEIGSGFVFKVDGENLGIGKKGMGKVDTILKKEFEIVDFTIPANGGIKHSCSMAFESKDGKWTMRNAAFAKLNTTFGKLELYDVDCNGRFDDAGVDVVRGLGQEDVKLEYCSDVPGRRGLFCVSPSGASAKFQPVSTEIDFERIRSTAYLNQVRSRGFLPPILLSESLCKAVEMHARYMIANNLEHNETENPGMPGYSKEGAEAGKSAIYFFGSDTYGLFFNVSKELGTPTVIKSIASPNMELLGVCYFSFGEKKAYMLNHELGVKKNLHDIVVYPFPGQTNVQTEAAGSGIEKAAGKDAGQPVMVIFPPASRPTGIGAYFRDDREAQINFEMFSPERPYDIENHPTNLDSIILVPKYKLPPNTTFNVGVSWERKKGAMEKREWSFRTGAATKR